MELQIKLLEGINDIDFGISKENFIEKMGQPAQTEVISEPDDPVTTILLEYPELQTSFFFEGKNDKYHLNSCDTNNPESVLFGKKIFSMNKKEIAELFNNMGFEKYKTATEEWGEMRMTFENSMCDLYFDDGKLSSVIWGY
jgi:hypothetical protein